jgi:hypothetical protein
MNANLKPALLPEDGAKFIGEIQRVGSAYRATCYAMLDLRYAIEEEESRCRMCETEEEAKDWIDGMAAARGFKSWWHD